MMLRKTGAYSQDDRSFGYLTDLLPQDFNDIYAQKMNFGLRKWRG